MRNYLVANINATHQLHKIILAFGGFLLEVGQVSIYGGLEETNIKLNLWLKAPRLIDYLRSLVYLKVIYIDNKMKRGRFADI